MRFGEIADHVIGRSRENRPWGGDVVRRVPAIEAIIAQNFLQLIDEEKSCRAAVVEFTNERVSVLWAVMITELTIEDIVGRGFKYREQDLDSVLLKFANEPLYLKILLLQLSRWRQVRLQT